MANRPARFTMADLMRAGKAAKELGPEWYIEIAPAPNNTISIVRDPTITPKGEASLQPKETRRFTRRELYDLVWSTPIPHLTLELGVSDHLLTRICERHRVPMPPRGFWANKASGKKVRQAIFARTDDPEIENIVFRFQPAPSMITGRQIREARQFLGLDASRLCERAKLQASTLQRAESTDSTPPLTIVQAAKIQAVCEAAGVVFDPGGVGVRLRKGELSG